MAKKSFVQINGALWEKTGENTAIVAGENWYCICGHWTPADAPLPSAPSIMPDIAPYRSMLTGEMITSRSSHRAHLRQHGCVEVGNERVQPKETWTATKGLREELISRLS